MIEGNITIKSNEKERKNVLYIEIETNKRAKNRLKRKHTYFSFDLI